MGEEAEVARGSPQETEEATEVPEPKPAPAKPAALPDKQVVKPVTNRSQDTKPAASKARRAAKEESPEPPGRTTYNRDFLLSFKQREECQKPPLDLMSHDCFRTP